MFELLAKQGEEFFECWLPGDRGFVEAVLSDTKRIEVVLGIDKGVPQLIARASGVLSDSNLADARQVEIGELDVQCDEVAREQMDLRSANAMKAQRRRQPPLECGVICPRLSWCSERIAHGFKSTHGHHCRGLGAWIPWSNFLAAVWW